MKTIVGSFDSFADAKQVAHDLMDEGFRDADVNVVASNLRGDYSGDATARDATGTTSGTLGAGTGLGTPGTTASTLSGTGYASGAARDRDLRGRDLTTDGSGMTTSAAKVDDASGAAAGAVTGGVVGGAAGLAASLMGLAIPGIGPIIAAGPIVAALSGAGVGAVAGGLIGGLTDMGVSKPDAEFYAESVRRGGALVTVRADDDRADRAADIMREHGAIDVERRAEQWREKGWNGFNADANPYTSDDLQRDRDLYGAADGPTALPQTGGVPGDRAASSTRSTTGVRRY